MANATNRLGVIPTMSTSFYPPFLLARLCSTVDHIARGRFGWNVVTSGEDRSAQNFGLDKLYEHDERYARASEYMELVGKLWESWEPDAIQRDYATGTYADYEKVNTIDFEGKYFKSRGPLNTAPSPQYRPTIAQAGASPPGRELAAQHADTIVAPANGVEAMRAYRDDIHARMKANGRDPAHCKVLYLVSPIVADTTEEALAKRERWFTDPLYIEYMLAEISSITEIDFAQFDLDEPLPEVSTNGERGSLESFMARGRDKTLRELVTGSGLSGNVQFTGTPTEVAEEMGALMEQVGGDGYLITVRSCASTAVTSPRSPMVWSRSCRSSASPVPTTPPRCCATTCASFDSDVRDRGPPPRARRRPPRGLDGRRRGRRVARRPNGDRGRRRGPARRR
jgi:FMN-dependent oxidoreductase (nitrilotriacetate monooxygenase family)